MIFAIKFHKVCGIGCDILNQIFYDFAWKWESEITLSIVMMQILSLESFPHKIEQFIPIEFWLINCYR